MAVKNVISAVLLLFVAASVAYLVADESLSRRKRDHAGTPSSAAEARSARPGAGSRHKLIAYYFHHAQRCRTCLNIEIYAEQALRTGLSEAFERGDVEWRAVNLDEPSNEHLVDDYELAANSLVMVLLENGKQRRWKNLESVWELVDDESKFKTYVLEEARTLLKNQS